HTSEEVAQKGDATDVHLPSPSYWPLVAALALPIVGYGMIFNLGLAAVGGVLLVAAIYGWAYEPADDPEAHHAHLIHGNGEWGDGPGDGESGDGDGNRPGSGPEPAAVGASSGPGESEEEASSDD